MNTLRSQEGYILLANEHAPPDPSLPVQMQAPVFEAASCTCSHCQAIMIVDPLRQRPLPYCRKCNHSICSRCELVRVASGYDCLPFKKLLDLAAERFERGLPLGDLLHELEAR